MAAFCACCGAEITLKAEACPKCGTPQHGIPVLNDVGDNAPSNWEYPFGTGDMHVALAIYSKGSGVPVHAGYGPAQKLKANSIADLNKNGQESP